jgi:hypothetical protein
MAVWSFYGHLLYLLYLFFSRFGMLFQEKSGNPAVHQQTVAFNKFPKYFFFRG